MRNLRIVFMGTPEFAVASLKNMIAHNYKVVGVVTAPDRPAGRGRKLKESAVKEYALTQNIPVLQPTNLKNPDFIEELRSLQANVQVVVAFRMLPKMVWDMPEYGTFNLHASLLPAYRGAAPINWAIINGEETTGVTTFFIDEKIDTGVIIKQEAVSIDKNENAGSLHDKLMLLGAELVIQTLQQIKNNEVKVTRQTKDLPVKTAYKLHKENTRIDWNQPSEVIVNLVRGLSPYPAAWTIMVDNDREYVIKIYQVAAIKENHQHSIGKIVIDQKQIKVFVADGIIKIEQLQLPGKKMMTAQALLNGFQFAEQARVV